MAFGVWQGTQSKHPPYIKVIYLKQILLISMFVLINVISMVDYETSYTSRSGDCPVVSELTTMFIEMTHIYTVQGFSLTLLQSHTKLIIDYQMVI